MTINSKSLNDCLSYVRHCAKRNATLPILSTVLVDAKEGRATFRMSDLDVWLTTSCECEAKKPLRFCVTAAWLAELATGDEELSLELDKSGGLLTVKGKSRKSALPTLLPDEFPEAPIMGELILELDFLSVDIDAFSLAIKNASDNPAQYVVNCPWLLPDGSLVATNGRGLTRLPLIQGGIESEVPISMPHTVPWSAIGAEGGRVILECDSNKARVVCGTREAIAKRIDGTPPNFQSHAPALWGDKNASILWFDVERDELTDALKSLAPHDAGERSAGVKLSFGADGLTMFHETVDSGTRERNITAKGKKEAVIHMGITLGIRSLSSLPDGALRMGVMPDASQILFMVGEAGALLMAVRQAVA